ncbi:PQQ-dependent sugar dehydrogenase [Winogradskyella sp.]|uniref:PQQ-dependent sugar dehydrogenase n=1 Tax=Winogradskyella sp. TaxID=1883156 RepID=UPI003F6C4AC4
MKNFVHRRTTAFRLRLFEYNTFSKIRTSIFILSTFLFLSVLAWIGPGLYTPQPIGPYLNGVFPPLSTASPEPYRVAFENLSFFYPITFNQVPNQNKIVLGQLNGVIYWFENDEQTATKNLLLDLSGEVGMVSDGGFLGLTIHPNFGNGDNYFYVYYATKNWNGEDSPGFGEYTTQNCSIDEYEGNFLILERFEVNPGSMAFVSNSRTTLLKRRMYGTTHRGGGLDFGTDGFLYLTTGDQASWQTAQDYTNNLDGGVLRIDVDKDPNKSHPAIRRMPQNAGEFDEITGVEYWIPNDNPFLSPSGLNFEEYWSVGLRNPHRMTRDKLDGTFYIGDVGLDTHEEINILKKGKNYGWPLYEGFIAGPGCYPNLLNNMPHETPLVAFSPQEANSITGGFVYRGTEMPELYGRYICADFGVGDEIWSVDTQSGEYELLGNFLPQDVISFGQDNTGELFLLKGGFNTPIYKMTSTTTNFDLFPQTLSETGLFTDLSTLDVIDGVVQYDLVDSFWSDGALKRRWIAIPNDGTHDTPGEQIKYSENGDWEFPIGSVLIKHFDLSVDDSDPNISKKVETRFSIMGEDGHFYFLTYNWNDNQTDAVLQSVELDEIVDIATTDGGTRTQTWHFPSNTECIACHNSANKGAIGLKTRYLNKDFTYDETNITANQLVTLSHLGIIDETITDDETSELLTYKSIYDTNATLDEKARSYMDLNCAYCHRPDTDNRAAFDLRMINNLAATGLLEAGVLTPLGIPDEEIIYPGDASKSILFHRMNSVDQIIMMPPIAKTIIDQDAVDLIEDWIDQLDPPDNSLNAPDDMINLALLPSARLAGSVTNGRGSLEEILYDPRIENYYTSTDYNEYGVHYMQNLGTPDINDAFNWEVTWPTEKYVNYITFGGAYLNQPQPNSMWEISYFSDGNWVTLDSGQGGWINGGIFEWGGGTQTPVETLGVRVQIFSDGNYDLVSIHLRGRGGTSLIEADDSATTPKAALIQYLSPGNNCGISIPNNCMLFCDGQWINGEDPSETTGGKDVILGDGVYTISENTNVNVNNLEISSAATLIIKEGASVTVNGNLINEGILNLESTSSKYSSLIVIGTSTGEINYKRHVNDYHDVFGNDLISSPVSGQSFGNFAASNPNIYENPDATHQKLFGPFNESNGTYEMYSTNSDASKIIINGNGYRAARDINKDNIYGTTITFSGELETSTVTVPITESPTEFSGWNLVGNPYSSYISFNTFFELNKNELDPNVHQAIYGYDDNATDGWVILNNISSDSLIAPGQGFFVKTKPNGATISFTPDMRIGVTTDDFILGRLNQENYDYLKLKVSNTTSEYVTEFYFTEDATIGLDPGYDAGLFNSDTPDFSIFSNLVQANLGEPLAIQVLNTDVISNVTIPLGLNALQGQQITVSIADIDIPENINIYLEDVYAGTFTLLNTSDYIFTTDNNLSGTGRFYLRFQTVVLNNPEQALDTIKIYSDNETKNVIIGGQLAHKTILNLYDIHGRIVRTQILNTNLTKQYVDVSLLSTGIYIVELKDTLNQRILKKVVIH